MKDRIRQLMEQQHMNQQTFAQFIGMSSASLSSIFNDRTKPTLNTVEAIKSKIPNLSTDWLMFGKGKMFIDDDNPMGAPQTTSSNATDEPLLNFSNTSSTPQMGRHPSLFEQGREKNTSKTEKDVVNFIDKIERKITEIRVFYDDQTWESFIPKKS